VSNVFELQAQGFTHIEARCGVCRETGTYTFSELGRKMPTTWATTLAEVRAHLRCDICPGTLDQVTPARRQRRPKCYLSSQK